MSKLKKLVTISIIVLIIFLSILPLNYVFAGSASCSGSPVTCLLADAFSLAENLSFRLGLIITVGVDHFHLIDNSVILKLGKLLSVPNDNFHLIDPTISVTVINPSAPIGNIFFNGTTTTASNAIIIATDNVQDIILTQLAIPIVFIIAVIFFAIRLGIKEFPIILGIVSFAFLGTIYIGILPSWTVIFPVLMGSGVLALMVSKWLGARGTAET